VVFKKGGPAWNNGVRKLNDFSYVLNDFGQIDYVLVDILSPKYGFHQMSIELDDVDLLKDGTIGISYDPGINGFYVYQIINGKPKPFHRRLFPDILPYEKVDHIYGQTLDNRRKHLKKCLHEDNTRNTEQHRNGKLVGTTYDKQSGRWKAQIRHNKRNKYIGTFDTELEAHQAWLDYRSSHGIK
jgi:hypothetical protein